MDEVRERGGGVSDILSPQRKSLLSFGDSRPEFVYSGLPGSIRVYHTGVVIDY